MNKKGFTLIELLAVIVILAIIALISTPMILGVINNAKTQSYVQSVNGILDAGEKYLIMNSTYDGYNIDLTSDTLDYKGAKPKSGTLLIDEEGNMSIVALYDTYCIEKKFADNKPQIVKKDNCVIDNSELEYAVNYKEAILNGTDPVLSGGLIPITISNDGTVKYADTKTKWYSYTNKEWANAVKLISSPSKAYAVGDTISENDIESYFVWIPRYKYRIFNDGNYDKITLIDSTKVQEIEIVFENKNTSISQGSTTGSYLTHPAFTAFGTNGMWVGKFETGYKGATTTATAQVNSSDSSKIIVKPNVYSWRNIQVANAFTTSYNYLRSVDSHMMKNTEWGAVAYLSHSKYGIENSIRVNNNSSYITGYAAVNEPTCGYTASNEECNKYEGTALNANGTYTNMYNTDAGYKATTTGNITGIYDMSGGAWEYMMAVTSDADGNPLSGRNKSYNSGFTGNLGCPTCDSNDGTASITGTAFPDTKYYDLYANNTSNQNYKLRILGDATGEMGPFGNITYTGTSGAQTRQIGSWYKDNAYFANSSNPWFIRGGLFYIGSDAGVFNFDSDNGNANSVHSFRLVLAP